MSRLTPAAVLATPVGNLAQESSATLFALKNDATDLLTAAKAFNDQVDRALDLKYRDRARRLRLEAGKDTGVVHFEDGPVRITADLPKKIEWNQARLAEITQRIASSGDDPAQYIEISYRVSETKFGAWPESLKASFVPARTLKTGKATFLLALTEPEGGL